MTQLSVRHETEYHYASPVEVAHHVACLQPISDAAQRLCFFDMSVEPRPQQHSVRVDTFGNCQAYFSLLVPHLRLLVVTNSKVDVMAFQAADAWHNTLPVAQVIEKLIYRARAPFEPACEYAYPSPHVPLHEELRDYASDLIQADRPVAQAAMALMHRIYQDFQYAPSATEISTPLIQVFGCRQGVCQDFAHLMIGCLRACGLAARYVSGYLLTQTVPGQAPLVGADASHAWVSVWCPGLNSKENGDWLDLDPTNNCIPANHHIKLAHGRDFGDVTPLRGVIRGGGEHTLQVRVTTQLLPAAASVAGV